MNGDWRKHLQEAGAHIGGNGVLDFGNAGAELAAAMRGDTVIDLSNLAQIEVKGQDASVFLAAQLTSDIRLLSPQSSRLSAWCSPQGRVLALFRVFRSDEAWFLLLPVELAEPVVKRLRMFVLRSQVSFSDISASKIRIGISGSGAADRFASWHGDKLPEPDAVVHALQYSILGIPGPLPRYIVAGDFEPMRQLWQQLGTHTIPAGVSAWALQDIEAALPQIVTATADRYLPQMLNLDLLDGLSFNKGCYPGQEVIARLKYRGQIKRRLYPGVADLTESPAIAERLVTTTADTNIGEIISAVPLPQGDAAVLAVIEHEYVGSEAVHIGTPAGPAARFRMPPYSLDTE